MKTWKTTRAGACILAIACLFQTGVAGANTQPEPSVVKAAEDVRVVSQEIAKAYFYIVREVRVDRAQEDLKNGLSGLDRNIQTLTAGVEDETLRNILRFMAFTRDEMRQILAKPYTREHGALILDLSESLLEGADAITQRYLNADNKEESMLVVSEKMNFLLERMAKYYIAFLAGFKDQNNVRQVGIAATQFETLLTNVNAYKDYPPDLQNRVERLNEFWTIAKGFYLDIENSALPATVFISSDYLESTIQKLVTYHLGRATAPKS